MQSTVAAVAFAVFAAGLAAADEKKYESKDGKYSVSFPGTPKMTSNKAGGIDLNIAIVEKNMGGFAVIYSDLPSDKVKAATPKVLLDGGQKGLVDNFKAKIASTKDFEFGKQKYPARELVAERDSLIGEKEPIHLRIQIILADNRLYQVFVVGPKELINGKEADAFFKSFEIAK